MVYKEIVVDNAFIKEMSSYRKVPKSVGLVEGSSLNPSFFADKMLGIRPYSWQVYVMELFRRAIKERALKLSLDISNMGDDDEDGYIKIVVDGREFVIITSRQIGKSTLIAIMSLWVTLFNKVPGTLFHNTSIIIISASDDQSKKLLRDVNRMLIIGDGKMSQYLGDDEQPVFGKHYFTDLLSKDDPNNTTMITFNKHEEDKHGKFLLAGSLHGSTIKSYPPTSKVLGECLVKGSKVNMFDGSLKNVEDIVVGDKVVSSDHFTVVEGDVYNVFDNGIKPIYNIETSRGKVLRVTGEHPVMTMDGWVVASKLTKGMSVAGLVKGLESPKSNTLFTDDEVKFLGYMLGDGSCVKRSNLKFTQLPGVQKDEFTSIVNRLGYSLSWCKDSRGRVYNASVGVGAWDLLERFGIAGKDSGSKKLPSFINEFSLHQLSLLLNRYYSCDGWLINTKGNRIDLGLYSKSEELVRQVQQQLLRFGIRSNIRKRVKGSFVGYELGVRSKRGVAYFIQNIGILGKADSFDLSLLEGQYQDTKNLIGDFEWESIKSVTLEEPQQTYGLSIKGFENHVTDGLLSHNTASVIWIDEAAFTDKVTDVFVFDYLYPVGNSTDAIRGYTSTPWATSGFFYRMVDPDGVYHQEDNVLVACFTVDAIRIENPSQYSNVMKIIRSMEQDGKLDEVQRAYYCRFVKGEKSYFQPDKVHEVFSEEYSSFKTYKGECDVGVDFGGQVNSRTVVTISALTEDGHIQRLYEHHYDVQKDLSLLDDIEDLMKDFNIQRVVVDDCPAGDFLIRKMEQDKNWSVTRMNFRSDKVKKFNAFRNMINRGKVHSYLDEDLKTEMNALELTVGNRQSVINHAPGYRDDLIDSWVISCYNFLQEEGDEVKFYEWS